MVKTNRPCAATLALLAATLLATALPSPVNAAPPEWADKGGKGKGSDERGGNGKGKGQQDSQGARSEPRGERGGSPQAQPRSSLSIALHFDDRGRLAVREYYAEQARAGKCPPGLAKRNNGCMPPGQAKKWTIGRPLPGDVVFYDLPQSLVLRLGPAPAGHRYVRVAADILLITIGTSMVIDAIQDLGSM